MTVNDAPVYNTIDIFYAVFWVLFNRRDPFVSLSFTNKHKYRDNMMLLISGIAKL